MNNQRCNRPNGRNRQVVPLFVLLTLCAASASAQVDLQGSWRPLPRNQDSSGMTGDVAGVPVTDAARWRVQSWSPEDFDVTEWACRPHAWDYSLEGPLSALRIWADIHQATQTVTAYHGHLNMQEQESTIWMDGRPHPPANALHTWSGFSTGEWDGDTLVVTTTHVKEAYLRRSGLMQSDQAVVRNVADNRGARLSEDAFSVLLERAEQDEALADKQALRHANGAVRISGCDAGQREQSRRPGGRARCSKWRASQRSSRG